MPTEVALYALPLTTLAEVAQQENVRFFQHVNSDSSYRYELFRRAIVQENQQAWSIIYAMFSPLVQGWVEGHPNFAKSGEDVSFFVNRAFEKMWKSLTPEKFKNFLDLKSLLRYLKLCTHSVIIDYARSREPVPWASLPEMALEEPDLEAKIVTELENQQFWSLVGQRLKSQEELRLLYYRFALDLMPREICTRSPQEFPDVKEVYKTLQKVLDRLGRDPEIKNFFNNSLVYEGAGLSALIAGLRGSAHNLIPPLSARPKANVQNVNTSTTTYAIARMKELPDEQPLQVNAEYILQAGIGTEVSTRFTKVAISLPAQEEAVHFDIVVHAEDMKIQPNWLQSCPFKRGDKTSLVEFRLKPLKAGRTQIRVEFYHERHWLAKIELAVTIVETQQFIEA